MAFENRRGKYKELGKKVPQAYRVYVEDTFLPCDAVIARIFSKEEDVYGIDYGFGLDAPKETEQANPQDLFAYRRNYTWNERNLLTKSSDRNFTVHYRYGDDGQRALKYTDEGRSETLYFNNFFTIHIPTQDQNNPQGLRVHKHIFVGNSRLVTAMTHTDNSGDNEEQKAKRYYYHSDHLGSAQFVTDWKGRQYEHIEYTPYGELWIEEVAAGLDKLPFRFTGKELDEETGLYYYGARYLDPKYSRWLSGDPALNDYIPQAPVNDDAKKHNENLPGMGGVFNTVNLHVYHYAGNNPVKYTDPDGDAMTLKISDNNYMFMHDLTTFDKIAEELGGVVIPFGFTSVLFEGITRLNSLKTIDVDEGRSLLNAATTIFSNALDVISNGGSWIAKYSGSATKNLSSMSKIASRLGKVFAIGMAFKTAITARRSVAMDKLISRLFGRQLSAKSHNGVSMLYAYTLGKMNELVDSGKVKFEADWDGGLKPGYKYNNEAIKQLREELKVMRILLKEEPNT